MAELTLSGSLIRGYRLHEMIGQGIYASIYRATRENLETDVAIKAIHMDTALEPIFIKRFEREARLISRLKHPHITPLHDYWRDEYGAYIVMEFYAGGNLRKQLKHAPFTIEETLRAIEACADALDYMHRNDVIHRDIKPDNIFFDKQGNAYLGDLGIAKPLDDVEGALTGAGDVLGTPNYSSPEQMKGDTISPQSDVFSLGVTLYEMLARAHPFPNISPAIAALRMLSEPIPHIDSVNDEINAVIQKATAKQASDRYASALEMALALREAVKGKTATAPTIEDLTPRELEVLQHLADGLNNNEIAEAMFIERPTVRWYLRQIYPKLGAESRGQAIVIAHQHGLIFRELEYEEKEEKLGTSELLKTHLKRHNLPAETGEFVGRNEDFIQIAEVLEDPKTRLLTILAPGGMGKTSFAIEVARRQFDNYRDGVYLIELARIDDAQQIPSAIAEALDFQFQRGDSLDQLLSYLQHKNLLLLMDNFEHLLDGGALISHILTKAPEVNVMVTSRERLNLRSEMIFSLLGLEYPATIEEIEEYESSALFIQEMRRTQPDFELNEESSPYILRICKLVEGMPLALILASAWGEMLSVEEIAREIQKSLDFLAVDMPDMPQRHWDMRVVLHSTWERLSQAEQDAFMKMCVFYGGCSREAAEKITDAKLRTLMSLVNKSLIRRNTDNGRFTIHQLLRQYAEEQLETSGEFVTIRTAHMNYFAQTMQECEAHLKDHRQIEALDDIERDYENVRAAWLWAIENEDEQALNAMCGSLDIFSEARNRVEEAHVLFEVSHKLQGRISERVWGRLLTHHRDTLDMEKRQAWLETALGIARQHDDQIELATTLRYLARALSSMGEVDKALHLAQESLELSEATGDIWGQASTKHLIAFIYQAHLDLPEQGYQFEKEAYGLFDQLGHPAGLAITLNNMGVFELYYRDVTLAQTYLQAALDWWRKIGQAHTWADTLSNLSRIETYQGRFEQAEAYVGEAYRIAVESGSRAAILMGLASRCNLLVMKEDFQQALEITREMVALRQEDDNPNPFWYVDTNQGIALCGLERYTEASSRIDRALLNGFGLGQAQWIARILLGKSLILASQGQHQRALELFALNITLPEVKFWYDKHPLAIRLQNQLQSHFDEADYQAIWEQGQAQADNWRDIVQALVDEIDSVFD